MYAIVEIGGQSHKVEEGNQLLVNLMQTEKGKKVEFDTVTMISDNGNTEIGSPHLKASVKAEVVEPLVKGNKLVVFKYHNKTNYRVKTGHRQKYTLLKITEISK